MVRLITATISLLILFSFPCTAQVQQHRIESPRLKVISASLTGADGFFSRKAAPGKPNNGIIIFIHGLGGDARATWTNRDGGVPWYDIVANDHIFDRNDIFVVNYSTSCSIGHDETAQARISRIVDGISRILYEKAGNLKDYGNVYFVGHSLGGIVSRALLVKRPDLAQKTKGLFLFGTPTGGSVWTRVPLAAANPLVHCPVITSLRSTNGAAYLDNLQNSWLVAAKGKSTLTEQIHSYCGYETEGMLFSLNFTQVVTEERARQQCTSDFVGVKGDHLTIVKPRNEQADPHKVLQRWYADADIGADTMVKNAEVVLATCDKERYGPQVKSQIEATLRRSSTSVARTPPLPRDWRVGYQHYLWTMKEPKLIVIHFSCFMNKTQGIEPSDWVERANDFAVFLKSLRMSRVKILAFSTAFDLAPKVAMEDVGNGPLRQYTIFSEYKRMGRLATVRVTDDLFVPNSPSARDLETLVHNMLSAQ